MKIYIWDPNEFIGGSSSEENFVFAVAEKAEYRKMDDFVDECWRYMLCAPSTLEFQSCKPQAFETRFLNNNSSLKEGLHVEFGVLTLCKMVVPETSLEETLFAENPDKYFGYSWWTTA
jgi:hypothetical protein